MSHNLEKEFFEHFKESSKGQQPSDLLPDLFEADDEQDEYAELGQLILRMQDGDIKQNEFIRLQQQLMADRGALERYIDHAYLSAGLSILLNKKQDISFLNHLVKV